MFTQQYQTARSILTACVFVGWAFVVIGGVLALISLDEGSAFLVSGVASALSGLFLVVMCQVAFAIFDQTENSSMSLHVLKMIAEKQGVDLSSLAETSAPPPNAIAATNSEEPSIVANVVMREDGAMVRGYKGREIVKIDKIYHVGETQFSTLGKAQRAISEGKV